jgi:hypothetical protein
MSERTITDERVHSTRAADDQRDSERPITEMTAHSRYRVDGRHIWRYDIDGTVTMTVYRRVESGAPSGWPHEFTAATEQEAEAAYVQFCSDNYDRHLRNAARRAKWGPLGTGKIA